MQPGSEHLGQPTQDLEALMFSALDNVNSIGLGRVKSIDLSIGKSPDGSEYIIEEPRLGISVHTDRKIGIASGIALAAYIISTSRVLPTPNGTILETRPYNPQIEDVELAHKNRLLAWKLRELIENNQGITLSILNKRSSADPRYILLITNSMKNRADDHPLGKIIPLQSLFDFADGKYKIDDSTDDVPHNHRN